MAEAGRSNGSKEQKFLEAVKRTILDIEEQTHQAVLARYASLGILVEYLSHKEQCHTPFTADTPCRIEVRKEFYAQVFPLFSEFTKGKEVVALSLIATLLTWTAKRIVRGFHMDREQEGEAKASQK